MSNEMRLHYKEMPSYAHGFAMGEGISETDLKPCGLKHFIDLVECPQVFNSKAERNQRAKYFIFADVGSRSKDVDFTGALFSALVIDIDEGNHSLDQLIKWFENELSASAIIHSTFSAKLGAMRWRVVLPLANPIRGRARDAFTLIINDKMRQAGFIVDASAVRTKQAMFAPCMRKGDVYEWGFSEAYELDAVEYKEEINQRIKLIKEVVSFDESDSRKKMRALIEAGEMLPQDTTPNELNAYVRLRVSMDYRLSDLFNSFGYEQRGSAFKSLRSVSGGYGINLYGDRLFFSFHESDQLAGFGQLSKSNKVMFGDAFDVLKFHQFANDDKKALFHFANKIRLPNGQTVHEHRLNQRTLNDFEQVDNTIPPVKRKGFNLVPVGQLLSEPMPAEWVIKGYLQPSANALVFGEPAAGKSLITIDWAASIAIGRDWNGCKVKQGAVIYLAGEGHYGISRRFKAWAVAHDLERELNNAPIAVSNAGAAIDNQAEFSEVQQAIREFSATHGAPVLIVVDTLHRCLQGDENSASDMSAYFRHLDQLRDEFGAVCLTVHHSGHSENKRVRGSSAIKAAVDAEFSLTVDAAGIRSLECSKQKDGAKVEPQYFELTEVVLPWKDDEGDQETSVIMSPSVQSAGGKLVKLSDTMRLGINTFIDALVMGDAAYPYQCTLEQWRDAFYKKSTHDNDDSKRQAFHRTRNQLCTAQLMAVSNNLYTLKSERVEVERILKSRGFEVSVIDCFDDVPA